MPEGDTVWRTANSLRDALVGHKLTTCDIRVPRYATTDFTGHVVESVESRGKHLLIRVADRWIHSHLKMEGAWHVYLPDSRWRRPAYQARIILANEERTAVGFELGVLDIVDNDNDAVGHLGPDLLGPGWNASDARSRMTVDPSRPIGLVLLDQRAIAGLGNVFRNEICFLRGIRPTTPVVESGDIDKWIDLSYRTIHANKNRNTRTMTGDLRPGRHHWVYGRENKPCRRCGTVIEFGLLGDTELDERQIYFCPRCQK